MSSSTVELGRGSTDDGQLHVAYDPECRMWWAVGREGSYGGARSRADAVSVGLDALTTLSSPARPRRLVVHRRKGSVLLVILRTRTRPSSQFFQDSVP